MTKFIKMILCQFALSLLFACIAHAQIAAAGWCVVQSSNQSESDQSNNQPPDDSFPPQEDDQSTTNLGCDIGVGFSLYRYKRIAGVAVLGSESLGVGIAWILNPYARSDIDNRPVIAIAAGIVTAYDTRGISRDVQFALGATLSLRSRTD